MLYASAVIGSYLVVYTGTLVAIVWPSVGIAVWWAVTCRSWRNFVLICGFVFLVPAFYLLFFTETSLRGVILTACAHVMSGPGVALAMTFLENGQLAESTRSRRVFAPFSRIRLSGDVFRLLVSGIVMVAISKSIVIIAYVLADLPVSFLLYLTMALRDFSGIACVVYLWTDSGPVFLVGRGPFAVTDETILAQATTVQLFVLMCILLSLVVSVSSILCVGLSV
ncbi:MASE1 domain-containing protein [Corynebacterium sp. L4756]|uniref:MASE1 domain-containing protein n=1 Tax=Corynebacterium sp. L4756 TaxID=3373097 RepID=UPI00374DEE34